MIKIFIPNFKKKYSINEKGEVWSHYRYMNNGKKIYKDKLISMHKCPTGSAVIATCVGLKVSLLYVSTLMKDAFNLIPPDNYHFYDLVPKDGIWNNWELKNLTWKIRSCDGNWKYYPKPFYDTVGAITHKRCSECGKKKKILYFDLQMPRIKNNRRYKRYTYRNNCSSCRATKQWKAVKSCPKKYKNALKVRRKWNKSEKGRRFHRKYDNEKRANLVDWYVKDTLSQRSNLGHSDITTKMINIKRKYLTIYRKLKTKSK